MKTVKKICALLFASVSLLALVACGNAEKKADISIATKPMVEQYILGEMLALLIEQEGYTVSLTKAIGGGTNNIHPGMEKGNFDLYPEYSSTGWTLVLKKDAKTIADEEMKKQLIADYEKNFGMTWLGFYGTNNTYTVIVRGETAREHNLKKTSDLVPVAEQLQFGANPDYIERADGYPAVTKAYGLNFKGASDIDIGLRYQALESKGIDVTVAYTTDAQLANPEKDVVALDDDKGVQANYYAATVVRLDTLKRFPKLRDALMKMDGLLTNAEMAELNYRFEIKGEDEREVARDFLTKKGLLKK